MDAIIISIGDELLNGSTINTNASWIASEIQRSGIAIHEIIAIADKEAAILNTLQRYAGQHDFIFITGGLGPTKDDITKNVLCTFFGTELIFHEEIYLRLKNEFEKRGIVFTENNKSQAMYPEQCELIKNDLGSAQGMWFHYKKSNIISMPGVPFEMKGMMQEIILPKILSVSKLPAIVNRYIMTSGMGESAIATKIEKIENSLPPSVSLAYLPSPCIVKMRLTMQGDDRVKMEKETGVFAKQIEDVLGSVVYAREPMSLEVYTGSLLNTLKSTLCTAESCTGGKIAQKITSVPGSSAYFMGSVVAYDNQVKSSLLHVGPDIIKEYGAVSEQVVSAMLDGALKTMKSDYAIAVSGVAGPSGGTDAAPVGTVYIGVAGHGEKHIKKYLFNKDRETNVEYASQFALHELRRLLEHALKRG